MSTNKVSTNFYPCEKKYSIKGEAINVGLRSGGISSEQLAIVNCSDENPVKYTVFFDKVTNFVLFRGFDVYVFEVKEKDKKLLMGVTVRTNSTVLSSPNAPADSMGIKNGVITIGLTNNEFIFKIDFMKIDNYNVSNLVLNIKTQDTKETQGTKETQDTKAPKDTKKTLNTFNKINKLSVPTVEIVYQTDSFGLNLNEMSCVVTYDKFYPNSYPRKKIGECIGYKTPCKLRQTFYSENPNIKNYLLGMGNTLYSQTKDINSKYGTVSSNCDFFIKIIEYSTLRYIFGGLSNNSIFSSKWLCSNNYKEFKSNMKNSDFKEFLVIFTDPIYGFNDYNKYYRTCTK